ncbi:MAG: hypothetical protein KAR79_03210 [Simkaniaceae bacterium]|nr:hypothetical protein [Simkaniaceae bacterium]
MAVGIFAHIGAYYPEGLVVVLFAGLIFIGFFIASKVLKMMRKDFFVLLAATPVLPVLVMVFFTGLSIVILKSKQFPQSYKKLLTMFLKWKDRRMSLMRS